MKSTRAREVIIQELLTPPDGEVREKRYKCEYCDKFFCTPQSKCKHKKTCPKKTEQQSWKSVAEDLQKQIEELNKKLEENSKQQLVPHTNNNTTNNIQNQQINNIVVINNFGNETMPQFTTEFLNYCIMNPTKGVTNIVEKIHFNEDLPENNNLRHKSVKNKTMEKYTDCRWHECDASNTLDELIKKGWKILSQYYSDMVNDPQWSGDERMYERFMFLGNKKSLEYNAVKRDLRLLVKDRTMYVVSEDDIDIEEEEMQEIHHAIEDHRTSN